MTLVTRPRLSLAALASTLSLALAACGGGDDGGPQGPSAFVKVAGHDVQASVASATPSAPTVKVTDAGGGAVRGVVINFAVTSGGGSIGTTVDTTDASGLASAGSWTLGSTMGQQSVTATSPSVPGVSAVFNATAVAGPAAQLVFITQPSVAAIVGQPFQGPVVEIQDSFGNRTTSTATVSIALGGNAGPAPITSGETSKAAVDGRATFGTLTTSTSGQLTMIATAPNLAAATSSVIAVASGPPAAIQKLSGDVQLGGASSPAFLPPMVRVTDAGGNPIAGSTVSFTVTSGGGSVSGGNVVTDADGIAKVGAWILGPAEGANAMRATAGSLVADFAATAAAPAPHQITLRYINTPTRAQQNAFERAWLRWRQIVRSELTDANFAASPLSNPCGGGGILPAGLVLNENVDDLIIYVNLKNIDGPNQVLGSAGPCRVRGTQTTLGLAVVGVMTFDTSDLPALETAGQLDNVILHEMGHVLGIGSLWGSDGYNLLNGAASDTSSFTGAATRAVWQTLGGAAGTRVPVENCIGQPASCNNGGTRDSHWRETTFRTELMTGYLNAGATNPLSALTIASLQDIGYTVDATRADAYTLPTAPPGGSGLVGDVAASGGSGALRQLVEAPLPFEPRVVDRQGASLGTITEWRRRRAAMQEQQ